MSSRFPQEPPSTPAGTTPSLLTKVTMPGLKARKLSGVKITALTAYDSLTAKIVEEAGIDVILVGDSLANTALGYEDTIPVELEEMLVALRAVKRSVRRALLVADMPFGSYQLSDEDGHRSALRFMKAGAHAVKIEGGRLRAPLVKRLVENGIPVMGHIGLTPQSVNVLGGFKVQGKEEASAKALMEDALALEEAGAGSVVLEGIPASLAATITSRLEIPTIGIGAGPECDGQILVIADLLGMTPDRSPKFVRRYLNFFEQAIDAVHAYRQDVLDGHFPALKESYGAARQKSQAGG